MKIALVILHADPMRGGAERYTFDLAAALAQRGHSVTLLATSFAEVPAGVAPVQLESKASSRTRRYLRTLDSLDSHLDRTPYDIVHAMLPVRRCSVYHPHAGLALAAVRDKPLAALLNPRRRAMSAIERHLLGSSHPPRVLCLSQYVKQAIEQHYPLDDAHLPILFNAVDIRRFAPAVTPAHDRSKVVTLIIAQDFERKGLREAILALARVNDRRLVLRVAGKQDPSPYRRLAERAGVAERVEFIGPTRDPAGEYQRADFFVLPTRHDPCSLVVLEALATGLPVISTRFNGACEIMTDGVHGHVLPDPSDVGALAAAMGAMLDADKRAKMSSACLDLRPQLSYEQHLDRLLQIYERCAIQSAPKAASKEIHDV